MMRKMLRHCGLPLLFLGLLLLLIGIPTHLCDHNAYLVLSVVLLISGLVWYVVSLKHQGKY